MFFSILLSIQLTSDKTWEVPSSQVNITLNEVSSIKNEIKQLTFAENSELINIEKASFKNSQSLEFVNLSNCLQLETISEDVFYNCTKLQNVILPGDSGNLKSIEGGAFSYTAITSIIFPITLQTLLNHSAIKHVGAFSDSSLSNISYYSENNIVEIYSYVFRACKLIEFEIGPKLEKITGPSFERSPITFIKFTSRNTNPIYSIYNDMLYKETKLIYCPPGISNPQLKPNTTKIGNEAFHYHQMTFCDFLPDSVAIIEIYAFAGCKNLKKVILPQNLTYIGNYTFSYCPELVTVIFSQNIEIIPYELFSYSPKLSIIYIPYGVKEIQDNAFIGCKQLKYINIPDSVKVFGSNIFKGSGIEECGIVCSLQEKELILNSQKYLTNNSFNICKDKMLTCQQNSMIYRTSLLFSIFISYKKN